MTTTIPGDYLLICAYSESPKHTVVPSHAGEMRLSNLQLIFIFAGYQGGQKPVAVYFGLEDGEVSVSNSKDYGNMEDPNVA